MMMAPTHPNNNNGYADLWEYGYPKNEYVGGDELPPWLRDFLIRLEQEHKV